MGMVRRDRRDGTTARIAWAASFMFCLMMLHPPGSHAIGLGGPGNPIPPGASGTGGAGGAADTNSAPNSNAPARKGVVAGPPAMKAAPVPNAPARKKPIRITPAMLEGIYKALLKTEWQAEYKELHDATKKVNTLSAELYEPLSSYQHLAQNCMDKPYTSEDQKNAGCIATDTLSQCSIKLFHSCFNKYHTGVPAQKKKMLLAADLLDKALKAYVNKLKAIPDPQ
jgi:hypothetical protein